MLDIEKYYDTLSPADRVQEAESLHERILGDAQRVVYALCDLCEHLKVMRDAKLYREMGFESFERYVEDKVGLKQRQAYTYISAYERLGKSVLQSNASLGITKLSLLAEVSGVDRADFLEEHDLDGMSVSELRALVDKAKVQGEQLGLLQEQVETLKKEAENAEFLSLMIHEERKLVDCKEDELQKLRQEHEELLKKPVEVAVAEVSPEELARLKQEALTEAEQRFSGEKQAINREWKQKVDAAKEKAEKAAKAELEKSLQKEREVAAENLRKAIEAEREQIAAKQQAAEAEREALKERAEQLERQMQHSTDGDVLEVNVYFRELQEIFLKLSGKISSIAERDPEMGEKLRAVVRKVLDGLA